MNLFRRLFCKHEWKWHRNYYGDEINANGGMRSQWRCVKGCGAWQDRPELVINGRKANHDSATTVVNP